MQITETNAEGLKRTLKVVVAAGELGERFSARLDDIKGRVQLKGFRKGRVPLAHLKKIYGRSLMAEVLQETVKETSTKAISERNERPAQQPDIALPEDTETIEQVLAGNADLAYSMSFEVLPKIEMADLSGITLERLVAEVDEAALETSLGDLADRNITFEAEESRAATDGDRVTMDFTGKIAGEPFEGGSGEGVPLVIGQGGFIPGFEDGLKGAKVGEERQVTATFPAEYPVKELAGKEATFEVKVKEVAKPVRPAIDDALAQGLGAKDLAHLKELVTEQIKKEYDAASRMKLKRELLDALDKAYDFELPPSLVAQEFDNVWRQLTQSLERSGKTLADEGKSEEEVRSQYHKIAERRVRLGLVIGEIGDKNQVQVTQDELRRALVEQARRYPGQEKFVYEYFEKTPGALAELRAPIFEDKVIDLLLEQVKPSERKVERDKLLRQGEEATAA